MGSRVGRLLDAVWYGDHPLRYALWPLSLAFRLAVEMRRALYRRHVLKATAVAAPVVVVGNLSVGGTGKTPCVIWLARELTRRGLAIGIITRGYGGTSVAWPRRVWPYSEPREVGDEPVLLAQRTGCAVAAGPDRVEAARILLTEAPLDLILSDDGLQHYRLVRAYEIAVVDGQRGLGNGLCLPAGPLREPESRLEEVDAVIVNSGHWGWSGALRAEVVLGEAWRLTTGERRPLSRFAGQTVHAVAGIGHPGRFFASLRAHGLVVAEHPLPDHAEIRDEDLRFEPGLPVMITEKDAVKCRRSAHDDVWCVAAELEFLGAGGEALLDGIVRRLELGGQQT